MKRELRVWGWTGARASIDADGRRRSQSREIVAATSAAAARRLSGYTRTQWENSACETGNAHELATALAEPGVIFWQPLNYSLRDAPFERIAPPVDGIHDLATPNEKSTT